MPSDGIQGRSKSNSAGSVAASYARKIRSDNARTASMASIDNARAMRSGNSEIAIAPASGRPRHSHGAEDSSMRCSPPERQGQAEEDIERVGLNIARLQARKQGRSVANSVGGLRQRHLGEPRLQSARERLGQPVHEAHDHAFIKAVEEVTPAD